jgi:CheY-like chemotaxis protein
MTAQVPDLILTDLEMPGISGIELIKILRADPKFSTVPILMLTGKSNPATMGEAIHAGADSFMAKADIRTDIFPKLLALARTRTHYQNASRGMQLDAVKALIGTYKHEFGNAIAAIDGKLRKLERTVPSVAQDEAYLALKKWNARLIDTLGKLDQLRNYQEEQYVDSSKMMKVG